MSIRNRVIRIFVSSTFEDMRIERDVLQRNVYPYLLSLCAPRGWQVDFVDLRWGISKEAGVQQKTMRICLEELRRCREVSPRPNFLILQGQRYGWCPLPETIEARWWPEVELAARAEGTEELLHRWYRRDDNNVPPHYELRGKDEFPERQYDTDYEVYEREVEVPLRAVMRRFAASHHDLPYDTLCRFVASATEQEIMQGALSSEVVPQQVAAFIRTVTDLDADRYEGPLLDARRQREEARAAIERLKSKVEARLAHEHQAVYRYDLTLRQFLADEYKTEVEQRLKRLLENLVLHEMDEYERKKLLPWEVERYRQEAFVDQRTRFFYGREAVLERMTAFVDGRERLFCLEGASGTGKSSVMAMVYRRLSQRDDLTVLFRSIGEGTSTSGQSVLCSMMQELRGRYQVDGLSDETDKMSYGELVEQCHRLMYTYTGRTLVLMIDAMDQLPKYDPLRSFDWMPPYAEGNVRVVVSRISDDHSAPLPAAGIWWLDSLAAEGREGGRRILLDNMAAVGRTLGLGQQEVVLDLYERGGYHPIYLKLMAGVAAEWHADAEVEAGDDYTLTMRDGRQRVTLPSEVARLVSGYFALLGGEGRHGLIVREVLAFLVLTRRGVADGEVQRLLALDEDFMDYFRKNAFHDYKAVNVGDESLLPLAFPSSIWTRFYYDIRFLLTDHIVVGGAVNGFNHRQVYEGAKMYLQSVHFDEAVAFRLLTTYFGERYRLHDVRALEELPRVLKKSGRVEEQMQLLEDIDFIQGKVQNGLVFDLVSDYRVALETASAAVGRLSPAGLSALYDTELVGSEEYRCLLDKAVIARHMQTLQVLMDFVVQELPTFVDFASEHVHFTLQLMHNIWADGPLASLADAYMERAGSTLPEMYLRTNRPRFVRHHLLMQRQQGHSWCINALAVSADGDMVLTASDDKRCMVWDMVQRKPLRTYFGHNAQVSALAVTGDMGEAYSGSWDGTVLHWHVASGLTRNSYPSADSGRVTALVAVPDGGCVAGYSSGRCRWLVDGAERMSFSLQAGVSALLMHQGKLWIGLSDGTVHTLGLDGRRYGVLSLDGEVRCLAARSDGSVTVSTAKGHFYRMEGQQVSPLFSLPMHEHLCPNDFRFSLSEKGGLMAVVADYDIRILTLDGKEKQTLHGHSKDVAAVVMLADGSRLFSAGRDKCLMMWNLKNLGWQEVPVDNPDYVRWFDKLVYLSRQTSRMEVVAASTNGRIVRWASKERRGTLLAEGVGPVYAIDVAPDGHTALCSGGDREVFVLDLNDGRRIPLPEAHSTFVNAVRIAPTGRYAATNAIDEGGSGEGTVLAIWDMQSLRPIHRLGERDLTGHPPYQVGGVESDSGIHPVTGRYVYSRLADAPTMDNIIYINGSHGVAFSPCGHLLAVACRDCNVALLDVQTGRVLRRLGRMSLQRDDRCHYNEVKAVAFSSDGRYLFSGSWDNSLIMWDLYASEGHEFVIRMAGHRRGIYSIDVAADGKTVVSGANDHSFIIWNVSRMLELAAQGRLVADHRDGVAINRVIFDANCNSVAFTRDGVVAGLGSGDVAVVDNSKGETLRDVPFVTAIRSADAQNHYVVCPCCGSKVPPPGYKLERILARSTSPLPSLTPSTLSAEALSMICPSCHNMLRLNHFIAD